MFVPRGKATVLGLQFFMTTITLSSSNTLLTDGEKKIEGCSGMWHVTVSSLLLLHHLDKVQCTVTALKASKCTALVVRKSICSREISEIKLEALGS